MSQRVYRIRQLASEKGRTGLLPVGSATIWRWTKSGRFPQPFKLGAMTTVWDAAEVDAFIAAQRRSTQVGAANV